MIPSNTIQWLLSLKYARPGVTLCLSHVKPPSDVGTKIKHVLTSYKVQSADRSTTVWGLNPVNCHRNWR